MPTNEQYRLVKNQLRHLEQRESLAVIWAYSQFLQLRGFRFPRDIEMDRRFRDADLPQAMIGEWTLELMTREIVRHASPAAERGRTLRTWATLASIAQGIKDLEEQVYSEHSDPAQIHLELMRISHRQVVWQQQRPRTQLFVRHYKLFNRPEIDAICNDAIGLSDAERLSWQFRNLVKSVYRLAAEGRAPTSAPREMFETAQWALGSEAARSLTQMAARGTRSDAALATLVRERQDLAAEWQRRELLQTAMLGQEAGKRDGKAESENNTRMAAIAERIADIDTELAVKFPDYTALVSPAPLSLEGAQAQLHTDEALMLFVDTPDWHPVPQETFIWVITKTDLRWVRSDLGTAGLTREVAALRCGLDRAQWEVPTAAARCGSLLGVKGLPIATAPLPFDLGRAHSLYKALFGAVEDLIKDKHLLIVPSGALTQLPFQVLITAAPEGANYRTARWLARDHALTVLPAVSSLKALRATSRPSAAARPLIGFGNPLLDGPDARYLPQAKEARSKQDCPRTASERGTALSGQRGAVAPILTRGGLVDPSLIRVQSPLPETADELCAVARDIGADAGEIHLGARATEAEVKRLSETSALAQYRVVHFSTHGTMAGQLSDEAEPGLLLTPPETASETDDGYLTSSEIAGLKLDAEWVILSACNTAAGDATSAEALSGLARAFFYAQARALLVSHWAVETNAAVALITGTIGEITRDKGVGRAEALSRAMRAMIDKGETYQAHPEFWAPFVVVGEGGR